MPKIYSTMTCPTNYAVYEQRPNGEYASVRDIIINGGHGLTNRHGVLIQGTETEIDLDTLVLLEKNPHFCVHRDNGFLIIDRKKSISIERALSELNQRDGSAPFTGQDVDAKYDDGELPVPVEEYVPEGKQRKREPRARAH